MRNQSAGGWTVDNVVGRRPHQKTGSFTGLPDTDRNRLADILEAETDKMTIDPEQPQAQLMDLVVRGLLPATGGWTELFRETTREAVTPAEAEDYRQELEGLLDVVSTSYRDGKNASLRFGSVRVNVQSFAAIQIHLVPTID
jgi:hypothetical protein